MPTNPFAEPGWINKTEKLKLFLLSPWLKSELERWPAENSRIHGKICWVSRFIDQICSPKQRLGLIYSKMLFSFLCNMKTKRFSWWPFGGSGFPVFHSGQVVGINLRKSTAVYWGTEGKLPSCFFFFQCSRAKSCPTLGDSMDCSLSGSSVHGVSLLFFFFLILPHCSKSKQSCGSIWICSFKLLFLSDSLKSLISSN